MKRSARTALAIVMAAIAGTSSGNEGPEMDNAAIRELVTGKRIYLATPLGGELPLYYRPDGRVDGSGEAIGLGRFLRPKDSGNWWVANNRLCQRWQNWYDGATICFRLVRLGPGRVRWTRDNGDSGVARIGN